MSKGCVSCLMMAAKAAEARAAIVLNHRGCCARELADHAKAVRAMADQEHTPTTPTVTICERCGHAQAAE